MAVVPNEQPATCALISFLLSLLGLKLTRAIEEMQSDHADDKVKEIEDVCLPRHYFPVFLTPLK